MRRLMQSSNRRTRVTTRKVFESACDLQSLCETFQQGVVGQVTQRTACHAPCAAWPVVLPVRENASEGIALCQQGRAAQILFADDGIEVGVGRPPVTEISGQVGIRVVHFPYR